MIVFNDIMQRIAETMDVKNSKRIYNKDIAKALDLTPEYFAVIKKREKIPYEAVALYCRKNSISMNWILFGQELEQLKNFRSP